MVLSCPQRTQIHMTQHIEMHWLLVKTTTGLAVPTWETTASTNASLLCSQHWVEQGKISFSLNFKSESIEPGTICTFWKLKRLDKLFKHSVVASEYFRIRRHYKDKRVVCLGKELLQPIPVAVRSKELVYSRSLTGTVGSNPAEVMDVCLLWVLCVVR